MKSWRVEGSFPSHSRKLTYCAIYIIKIMKLVCTFSPVADGLPGASSTAQALLTLVFSFRILFGVLCSGPCVFAIVLLGQKGLSTASMTS